MARQFEVVPDDAPETKTPERTEDNATAVKMITLALGALSQRALIALADMFTLITVMTGFVLWYSLPDPNVHQIVALGIYALFVLAANVIVRRFK